MANTFGTAPKFSGLGRGQVSSAYIAPKESSEKVDYLPEWLDWTLVGLEIAANFIPGIGTAISAGLGAIQASITTAELVQNDQLEKGWWQLGLAWGGVAFAGYGAMRQITKNTAKAILTKTEQTLVKAKSTYGLSEDIAKDIATTVKTTVEKSNIITRGLKVQSSVKGYFNDIVGGIEGAYGASAGLATKAELEGLRSAITSVKDVSSFFSKQIRAGIFGSISRSTTDDVASLVDRSTRSELIDKLSKNTGKLLDDFMEQLSKLSSRAVGLSTSRKLMIIRRFIRSLSVAQQAELRAVMWEILQDSTLTLNKSMRMLTGAPKNFWRFVNSSTFYQHEVQWFQNINASDLGRFIAEKGFQRLNAWFDKSKTGKWLIALSKKVPKILRVEGKLEKAFVQAGGKIINSRYLLGYRILTTVGTGHLATHEVLVKFRPHATNNKKPIFIKATTQDLEELSTQGSAYWWRVGQAKGWYISKGGKGGEGEVIHEVGLILSFLPIQALRSFGSIISNIKVFEHTLRKGIGAYPWEVFRNTVNTALNRTGRFGAKKVVGRIARSPLAGRIAQQSITMGLNASGGGFTNKPMGFEWKKPKSMLHLLQLGAKTRSLSELKKQVYKKTGRRPAAQGAKRKLSVTTRFGRGLFSGW